MAFCMSCLKVSHAFWHYILSFAGEADVNRFLLDIFA